MGEFEDNVFNNAKDMFDFLVDQWQFRRLYKQSKENGVAEYEDYEENLTEEQRKKREKNLKFYEQVFETITNQ